MNTTGLFTVHRHNIKLKGVNRPVKLIFFGDVHRDSPQHALEEWKGFLAYAKKQNDAVFVGMGDYLDGYSTSERRALQNAALHESTQTNLELLANTRIKTLSKELDFMKGRLIGLLGGNHYFSFQDGTNSDQRLCTNLGCKFLGVSTFVRLTLDAHNRRSAVDLFLHHGAGAGRTSGASINRVDQMREIAFADVFAMGHNHDRGVYPSKPRLFLENQKDGLLLKSQQGWLVRTGSFLKAYTPGEVGYNVDAGRGPCSLGHVELHMTLRRRGGEAFVEIKGVA
jgi:predicted phosphodiesterase